MSFAALFFLILAILLYSAAYKDVSPFLVIKAFVERKAIDEYTK